MNENLNLCEILRDCPKGTKLYSMVYGNVEFDCIESDCEYPIVFKIPKYDSYETVALDGRMQRDYDGECTLFPSREQRDWSKFNVNKPKFDLKTLRPFDRVLALINGIWRCDWFSHLAENGYKVSILIGLGRNDKVIPYNEETKHLVGTTEESPEFYRYWED